MPIVKLLAGDELLLTDWEIFRDYLDVNDEIRLPLRNCHPWVGRPDFVVADVGGSTFQFRIQ